jgi:zinc D-Ala-D-Ala carboxypeptidase
MNTSPSVTQQSDAPAIREPAKYPYNLSSNFTFAEAVTSTEAARNGIDNLPKDPQIITNLGYAARKMEQVRLVLNQHPIIPSSWYRCLLLNRSLKSLDTSDHLLGLAVDFICPRFGSPKQVADALLSQADLLGWKQLILEHTWVHISWSIVPNVPPKLEVLSLLKSGGYAHGLTNPDGVPYTYFS